MAAVGRTKASPAKAGRKPATKRLPAGGPANMGVQAKYDAAGSGRRMVGWNPPSSGPNLATAGLQKIRDRSRDVSRNDWAGESSLQKWTTTLIGIGIVPRFKRVTDKSRKQVLTDLWTGWCRYADADGVLDFYGLQTLAVRAWLESGEVFVRLRPRSPETGLEVPFQVQLVEADFVPMLDADQYAGLPEGHKIRQGIELNKYGRRIAYWMFKEHPGENSSNFSASDLIRVAASQVRHVFEVKRPGQLRGVPAIATVLARLREVGDYEDAVLVRQKISNLFVAFLKNTLPNGATGTDPFTNMPINFGKSGEPLAELAPGMFQELEPGQDVTFANPVEAGTTFSDYMRTSHLGTAAGAGIPYELFSGDIREVSDRTLRMIINEFRRLAQQRQWQIVIPMFCVPIIEAWGEAAVLAGKVTIAEMPAIRFAEWSPHGWEHIHPVQDPQGKKLEVEAGFRSRSSVIAEAGDDPDAVDDERAADLQREKDLELWVDPNPPPAGGQAPAGNDPANNDPNSEDPAV